MLVAYDEEGKKVVLTPYVKRGMLLQLRKEKNFYCPVCQHDLLLKVGTKKIPHFAHQKDSVCSLNHGESIAHMEGKYKLYEWLASQMKKVELEKYIKPIEQRADVYFDSDGNKVAIEFQRSHLPQALFLQRTSGYHEQDIHVLWLFGSNHWNRNSTYSSKINTFLALGTMYTSKGFMLLFYCEQADVFLQLSPLFSFSPQLVYSSVTFFKRNTTSFYDIFQINDVPYRSIISAWNKKKKKYRLYGHHYFYPHFSSFVCLLRKQALPPGCFPSEAGIPLQHGYTIETHAIIWQTYLLLECIHPMDIGQSISFSHLTAYMNQKVKEAIFTLRTLPLVQEGDRMREVVVEYMSFLINAEIMKEEREGVFQKRKAIYLPTTIEEGMRIDEGYSEIIEKSLRKGIQ